MKAKRRLKKVDVTFISLVDKGANQKTIIWKADSTENPTLEKQIRIAKIDEDQRIVYGVVYSPDEVDSQGDIAAAEVIKEMSYNFMKNRRLANVDQQHDFNPDEGFIAESWLMKENDPLFPDDPEGSWAVGIKVENAETWEKVKKGEISGLSMAGLAEVEEIKKGGNAPADDEDEGKGFLHKIRKWLGIAKDFNSALNQRLLRDYVWSLENAIDEILRDETITDKKIAILESVGQFTAAMTNVNIEKAGKVLNAKNLQRIRTAINELSAALKDAEAETEETQKNNKGKDMTPEEIKELVKSAVEDAVKPITEKLTTLETQKAEFEKSVTERVEKVEKATPGSRQQDPPQEPIKKANVWWPE